MIRNAVTTLLIHPDEHLVLMGRRSSVGAFANELVFPGGVIDSSDEAATHLRGTVMSQSFDRLSMR